MTSPAHGSHEPPAFQLEESVGYLLARVRSALSHAVNQRTTARIGITSTQAGVLAMLAGGKCGVAAAVAREMGIDASAVTRMLDRLESRGLITRERSCEDRRAVHLALTPQGVDLARQLPPIYNEVLGLMLGDLEPAEIDTLKHTLRRILACTDEALP